MMNRYQLAGAAAYRLGLALGECTWTGAKAHAWKVGWSLAWSEDEERMVGDGDLARREGATERRAAPNG
jgi:hypothetical protein